MAQWAIEHINDKSERYGAFGVYEYKTAAFPDGKENALSWMNYIISYITYERLKNQKDALPYLFKATQLNSATKMNPKIYKQIGDWYINEFSHVNQDQVKKLLDEGKYNETSVIWATQKGYLDRSADAFGRDCLAAPNDTPAAKNYRAKLLYRATAVIPIFEILPTIKK